jgi:RNA polymerase sigma-70 factor (ECF subfamily)
MAGEAAAAIDVKAARTARPPAFAEILRANQSMVFSIALHFFRNHETAEEVAQDVFLRLHSHLGEIESEAHAANWLRRATGNRCIDLARQRKLRSTVSLEETPEPTAPARDRDALAHDRIHRLIASLPEKARLMMVMRYQEEMMPEEIAKALNIPVQTVKSQLHRTLELLREKFARGKAEDVNGRV